jgi:hypothetical protein
MLWPRHARARAVSTLRSATALQDASRFAPLSIRLCGELAKGPAALSSTRPSILVNFRPGALITLVIVLCLYVTPYIYLKSRHWGRSNIFFGGSVTRPWGPQPTVPDFSFDANARSMGSLSLNSSVTAKDAVGWLATRTGWNLAGPLNILYYPMARLDHLFTGSHWIFVNSYGWPDDPDYIPFPE